MKMTSKYLLIAPLVLLQISISIAQNRLLSLEDGISLLEISKNQMNLVINQSGYVFDNRSGDIIAYSKYINDYKYYFTVVYKNSTVVGVSWTENGDYLPMYNNDIVANAGFVKDREFDTGEADVFSYKNYAKNLTVSFIWRYIDDKSHFMVTIGKIKTDTIVRNQLKSDLKVQNGKIDRNKISNVQHYDAELPDPRKINHKNGLKFETKYSKNEIITHY